MREPSLIKSLVNFDEFVKGINPSLSVKQESITSWKTWLPAFAGMTKAGESDLSFGGIST